MRVANAMSFSLRGLQVFGIDIDSVVTLSPVFTRPPMLAGAGPLAGVGCVCETKCSTAIL